MKGYLSHRSVLDFEPIWSDDRRQREKHVPINGHDVSVNVYPPFVAHDGCSRRTIVKSISTFEGDRDARSRIYGSDGLVVLSCFTSSATTFKASLPGMKPVARISVSRA